MKKNIEKCLSLTCTALVSSLLGIGGLSTMAFATGQNPAASATVKPRVNNAVTAGLPMAPEIKGVKTMTFTDTTATLVKDEGGVAPVAGMLNYVEISSGPAGGACYLTYYDSAVAADTTEAGSLARMLGAPLMAVTSQLSRFQFTPGKQFHRGLVGLMVGTCRISALGWSRIGGAD